MRKRKKWILWTLLLALCLGGCSSGTKVEELKVESGATEGETDPSQEETDPAGDFLEENEPKEEPKLLSLMTENKMDSVWEEGGQIVSTNYRKVWLEDREQGAVVGAGEFPELAEALREQYPDILPGYYSDKRLWVSALLDGDLPDVVLRDLCDMSYGLVVSKLPKYVQRELAAE